MYLSIATPEIVKPEMPPKRVVRRKLRTKDSSDEEDMVFTSGSDDTSDLSLDESDLTSSSSEESDSVTKQRHDKMASRKRKKMKRQIYNPATSDSDSDSDSDLVTDDDDKEKLHRKKKKKEKFKKNEEDESVEKNSSTISKNSNHSEAAPTISTGNGFEFLVNDDPALALALSLSMEDQEVRRNNDSDLELALKLSLEEEKVRQEVENAAKIADTNETPNRIIPETQINANKNNSKMVLNVSTSKNNPVKKSKHFCGNCDGCKRQDCKKCSSCKDDTRKRVCEFRICKKLHTMKYYNKNQYDLFVKRIGKIFECKFCQKKISTVRLVWGTCTLSG